MPKMHVCHFSFAQYQENGIYVFRNFRQSPQKHPIAARSLLYLRKLGIRRYKIFEIYSVRLKNIQTYP